MTVFKYYFKLLKSFAPIIIMYTVIFTLFGVVTSTTGSTSSSFESSKLKFTVHNEDKNNHYTEALVSYLKENAILVESSEKQEEDDLFFRKVDSIVTIPEGFGESVINGKPIHVTTSSVPDSANGKYLSMMIDRFIHTSSIYAKSNFTQKELIEAVREDMKIDTKVSLLSKDQDKLVAPGTFYNFSNYTILAICITVIGLTMNIFYHSNIKKRNFASPLSNSSINGQLFLGNFCFTFAIWLLYVILSIALYGSVMFTAQGLLLIVNSFFFTLSALSIGFIVGVLVKNKEAQSGLVNILALGSSFICGAFVPQQFLGTSVLTIAKIFPSYWYVKNNDQIVLLSNFNFESLLPIITRMGIMILFTIIIFVLTNIVSKYRIKKSL